MTSTTAMLTSRERVRCSLEWREPDRVPVQIYLTPEVRAMLTAHFQGRNLLSCLGVDLRSVSPVWRGPIREPHDGITYDRWGAGYRRVPNGRGGTYDEAVELPLARLQTLDDVARYPWPDPDDFDYSTLLEQYDQVKDYAVCVGGAGSPDILNGVSRGRGMEQVMIDIVTRDPVGLAIIDHRVDFEYGWIRRCLEKLPGKVDLVLLGEDCGSQNGRMFSPRDFEEVMRPRLQRFIDMAHEFGARAMMHSCGDTHEIMPTFIDMGLDVLDAMQPEPPGMDPETIRAACRNKLAFCGLISTQKTLPYGSAADCRAEARHRLDVIAPGGGYIFSPAHCIQPDTPLENILALYEEALGRPLG